MSGVNVFGEGVIAGLDHVKDRDAYIVEMEDRFAATPVFPQDIIPRGRQAHIGDGVWLKRCQACDDFMLTYGTAFIMKFALHEREHGVDVVGVNVPLLSR
jgi:hypothetical protein